MTWEELPGELDEVQRGVTVNLTALMVDLWGNLQAGGGLTALLTAIEIEARVGAFKSFDLGARTQHRSLRPGAGYPPDLIDAAEAIAMQRGRLVRDRAEDVLKRATERMVSPYARLAAQVLITDAARTGTRASALYDGATHKKFIRIRPVLEPRAHSRLEGKVLPIDEPFIIAGIPVHGPGDERLPWSERAFCGHGLRYLRR